MAFGSPIVTCYFSLDEASGTKTLCFSSTVVEKRGGTIEQLHCKLIKKTYPTRLRFRELCNIVDVNRA